MDKDQMKFLKTKRNLFQKEEVLRNMRNCIVSLLNYLQNNDLHFNLYYDSEHLNWINNNVKVRNKDRYYGSHGDFQIDVDDTKAIFTEKGREDDCLKLHSIAEFFNAIPNHTMLIKCSLSNEPELEITKYAFLSKPSLFLSSPENWLLSADKKFIIEKVNDDVVRFIEITKNEPILRVTLLLKD